MMTPIDPITPLAVTLQAQQWNAVLAILSDQPYRVAAPLIDAITGQANAGVAALPPPPSAPVLANGAERHVSD